MIKYLYCIKDHATEQHHTPFPADTEAAAKRMLASAANDSGSLLNQHPMDYSLHYIGEFDTDSGALTPAEKHCILPDMLSLKQPEATE